MSFETAAIIGMAIIVFWGLGALALAIHAAKGHHPSNTAHSH